MTTSDPEPSPSAVARLWLTQITGSRLVDRAGETLGRVEDVIVRLGAGGYPPVIGLIARVAGRQLFVPRDRVGEISPGASPSPARPSACSASNAARVRCCCATTSSGGASSAWTRAG